MKDGNQTPCFVFLFDNSILLPMLLTKDLGRQGLFVWATSILLLCWLTYPGFLELTPPFGFCLLSLAILQANK